jgi:hypothetical protein
MALNLALTDLPRMGATLERSVSVKFALLEASGSMRLFFHLFDGTDVILDHDGVEVDDLVQTGDAISFDVAELQREFPIEERRGWVLRVTDGSGTTLLSIPLDGVSH